MKEKEFIVAIELGSSAIRGIAGHRKLDGGVEVSRIVQVAAEGCVQRGVVYNIEKTTNAIRTIRETLERDLQVQVTRAYVGIQGQSLRTIKSFVKQTFDVVREVADADVDELLARNAATNYGDLEIREVIPLEYHLDNKEEDEPQGIQTRAIEGRFNNVVARCKLRENIEKCMSNAGLRCVDLIVTPLALAQQVLNDSERRSGCALVDFGAQTTTVQVYKGGKLRYLATLPLGGQTVTRDLASAKDIDLAEAEQLKLTRGTALIDLAKDEPTAELPISGDRTYKLSLIERVCEARVEEILRNVGYCIQRSEVAEQLTSGIYFTGGGAQMAEMTKAFMLYHPSYTKVHLTRPVLSSSTLSNCGNGLQGGNFDSLVALLARAEEDCTTSIPEPEKPEEKQQELDFDKSVDEQISEVKPEEVVTDDGEDTGEDEEVNTKKGSMFKNFWGWLDKKLSED